MFEGPKVIHLGAVPGTTPFMPKVEGFNAQKVSQMKPKRRIYNGSIFQYMNWKVIEEKPVHGGRVDILITKGKNIVQLHNVSPHSINTVY